MKNMKRIISLLMALMLMGSSVTANADMIVNSTGVSFSVRKMEENHQLNRFLYEVTVTDPDTKQKVTDDRFVQGKDYVFELKFQEGDHENQFTVNENGQMVYTYPEGLTVTARTKRGQNKRRKGDRRLRVQGKTACLYAVLFLGWGRNLPPQGRKRNGEDLRRRGDKHEYCVPF